MRANTPHSDSPETFNNSVHCHATDSSICCPHSKLDSQKLTSANLYHQDTFHNPVKVRAGDEGEEVWTPVT
ncbi:hypothetical protein DMENIID0001_129020 [Sergentomyia squamirostris]